MNANTMDKGLNIQADQDSAQTIINHLTFIALFVLQFKQNHRLSDGNVQYVVFELMISYAMKD